MFSKTAEISHFIKIRPVTVKVCHGDRRTDMTKGMATLRNVANFPSDCHINEPKYTPVLLVQLSITVFIFIFIYFSLLSSLQLSSTNKLTTNYTQQRFSYPESKLLEIRLWNHLLWRLLDCLQDLPAIVAFHFQPHRWQFAAIQYLSPCHFCTKPSQDKFLTGDVEMQFHKSPSRCLLAIPAFDRIAGLYNRHLISNRGICLR